MARVLIMGYYGFGNTGDEALLEAILGDLRTLRPDLEIAVLSARPEETELQHDVHAINRWQPLAVAQAIEQSDLLLTGGGSLLQDGTSLRSLTYYAGWILIAHAYRRPVMLYANGLGPLKTSWGKRLAKRALAATDLITLRDRQAEQDLRDLQIKHLPDVEVTADPTFSLTPAPDSEATAMLRQSGIEEGRSLLGIALRPWPGEEQWLGPLIDGIRTAAKTANMLPVLLPMQPTRDLDLAYRLSRTLPESVLVKEPLPPRLFMSILGRMDAVIGMRLHALILAATQAVPVAGIAYDPKVPGFLSEAKQPLLLDLHTTDSSKNNLVNQKEVGDRIIEFLQQRVALRKKLEQNLPFWHRSARRNAELAVQLLEKRN